MSGATDEATITEAILTLGQSGLDSARIAAASRLATIGLARRRAFLAEGLSWQIGIDAADNRLANEDHRDLHQAAIVLVRSLNSRNEQLRIECAFALSHLQLHRYRARHYLVLPVGKALEREFAPGIKAYLALALGDMGIGPRRQSAVPELAKLLLEPDAFVLASAARAFAKIGPDAYRHDAEARLIALVAHPDEGVREAAADALGSIGAFSGEADRALRAALADSSERVQGIAAVALMELGHPDASLTTRAAKVLRHPPRTTLSVDDIARRRATEERVVGLLRARGILPDEALDDLVGFIGKSHDHVSRQRALKTLARGQGHDAARADALVATMLEMRLVHPEALDGLAAMGPDVAPHLEPLLKHSDAGLRDMAAGILAKAGVSDERTIQRLIERTRKGGRNMGIEAVRALGGIRGADTEATRALVDQLRNHPDTRFKTEASMGLTRIGPGARSAIPELARWSRHESARLRARVMAAMVAVAPEHPATLDALRTLLRDERYLEFGDLAALEAAWPVGGQLVPDLVRAIEREASVLSREALFRIVAWHGHPSGLAFVRERALEKLHHGTVIDVAMRRLIDEVDRMRMHADADREDRRRCIETLGALGMLGVEETRASLLAIEDAQLGKRLRERFRAYRERRDGPRPPTMGEQLAALYAAVPKPRNRSLLEPLKGLHDPYLGTRKNAVEQLALGAKRGAVEAPGILAVALRDPHDAIRTRAARAFAELGLARVEHLEELTVLLHIETGGNVNEHAARALASLGEAGLNVLLEAGTSEEDRVRRAAAYGLCAAGAAAESARPRLEELSADPHVAVRTYARKALEKMDGSGGRESP